VQRISLCYLRIRYAGSLGRVARQVFANARELRIADLGLAAPARAGSCPAIALAGFTVGSRRQQQEVIRAIEANGLRPVIGSPFSVGADRCCIPPSRVADFGKIVLDI
jgi:hypothetical protein